MGARERRWRSAWELWRQGWTLTHVSALALAAEALLFLAGTAEAERERERRATRIALAYMMLEITRTTPTGRFEGVKGCLVSSKKAKRPRVALVCTVGTGLKESERQLEQTETRAGRKGGCWGSQARWGLYNGSCAGVPLDAAPVIGSTMNPPSSPRLIRAFRQI